MQKAILTMLITFITVSGTVSESAASDDWITGGLGLATKGFAYVSGFSVLISKDKMISVRFAGCTGGERSFGVTFEDHPRESAYDIGILIGTLSRTHSNSASFSIGPSYVSSVHRGELIGGFLSDTFEEIRKETIGVSFQTQLMWRYCGFLIFGNYNSSRSFAGVTFNFRFWFPE